MARVGTMTAAMAALLLLAVVVATAAAMSPPDAIDHQPAADGTAKTAGTLRCHRSRDDDDLSELAQCVTICGSGVTTCMMNCYEPLARGKGNPVALPFCLLACTTEAVGCGSECSNDIVN